MDNYLEMSSIESIFNDFVDNYVAKEKRNRITQFYTKKKNWWKIAIEFHTSNVFDKNVLLEIKPSEQIGDLIYKRMKDLGAKNECYSILDYLNDKNYNYSLQTKLNETVGMLCETVLYCPISKVGYFEGGHAKDRFIFKLKN